MPSEKGLNYAAYFHELERGKVNIFLFSKAGIINKPLCLPSIYTHAHFLILAQLISGANPCYGEGFAPFQILINALYFFKSDQQLPSYISIM